MLMHIFTGSRYGKGHVNIMKYIRLGFLLKLNLNSNLFQCLWGATIYIHYHLYIKKTWKNVHAYQFYIGCTHPLMIKFTQTHTHTHTLYDISTHTYTHIYIYIHILTNTHPILTHTYISTYIYLHRHTYTYTHIYTYTQTPIPKHTCTHTLILKSVRIVPILAVTHEDYTSQTCPDRLHICKINCYFNLAYRHTSNNWF